MQDHVDIEQNQKDQQTEMSLKQQDVNSVDEPKAILRRKKFAWISTILSLIIVAGSLAVLAQLMSDLSYDEVTAALKSASRHQISWAIIFTLLSYFLLTFYDALALKQMRIRISYWVTALASFTSYAISFSLSFPLLTAGTVRYWIYSSRGMSAGRVANLTIIAGITFWLGMTTIWSLSLLRQHKPIAKLVNLSESVTLGLGILVLTLIIAYLVWVSLRRRSKVIQGWLLELPGLKLSLSQMLIGAADVCSAAAVLYVLLPKGHHVGFELFLAIYLFAMMLGTISHSPGGLGVFEATMLLALSTMPAMPKDGVLGALLLFRVCYYIIPFFLALLLLGAHKLSKYQRVP